MKDINIIHIKYGKGSVIKSRFSGYELLVHFMDGVDRWIKSTDIYNNPVIIHPPKLSNRIDRHLNESFNARRMIEAFRVGIVPYDQVGDFTFGRNKEINQIKKYLSNDNCNNLFIFGHYGTGKTHLLSYMSELALDAGYITAFSEMDGNEVSFSKPKSVYNNFAKTLVYKNENKQLGFRDLVKNVINEGGLKDHKYFRTVKSLIEDDDCWNWIMGEPSLYYYGNNKMLDHMTAANLYCYLLSGLGWAVKNILGYKGLLLIFDESESLFNYYNYWHWEKANNFVNALIRTANDDQELIGAPWKTNLTYSKIRDDIPFIYKAGAGIKLVFAFTPNYYATNLINSNDRIMQMELKHLSNKSYQLAFTEILSLYNQTYGENIIDYSIIEQRNHIRSFVKEVVERLDMKRHGVSTL